ncbi:ATP-binding protein [Candidatus Margulisiibacteriota bacterium]
MDNPFVFGEAVAGAYFTDRVKELKEIKAELKNGQNIIIFSPRRYGKTSLIKKVLAELKKEGLVTVYLDLFFINSKQKFVDAFAKALSEAVSGPFTKAANTLGKLIPKIVPKIVIKTGGDTTFEFDYDRTKKVSPILEDLYDSIHKYAKRAKKKAVVVFDEFQELLSFDDGEIESGMRSKFQFHRNVAYVFLGSKRKLMLKLFNDKSRPFYNSGRKYYLKKIDKKHFLEYVRTGFAESGLKVKENIISDILDLTRCHPYYTQEFCHFIWEQRRGRKKLGWTDVEKAVSEIIASESANYTNIWSGLTARQKGFLIALANNPGINIYSNEFNTRCRIGTSSTIQRQAGLLYDKQIIEKENGKVILEDVFFEKWIKENT